MQIAHKASLKFGSPNCGVVNPDHDEFATACLLSSHPTSVRNRDTTRSELHHMCSEGTDSKVNFDPENRAGDEQAALIWPYWNGEEAHSVR